MPRKRSDTLRIVILIAWIAGFLIGTTTHVTDLVLGGADTYAEFPLGTRVFWMSLTVLDPITAVLLARRRRAGIVLALVVILVDIAVNWTVFATIGIPLFGVVNQTLFAILLISTAPMLWRWFGHRLSSM
ncbi:hypothetical protein PX701_18090 [Agromyces sp. H3Y2-19a]|uniref:hypothetical protein n=1 Tax=Agromyces chromiiresistens TaxID=3030835 RepID=UPI0023B88D0D|nr:hypothetical protein [Agromyces chromiiresistens]MDF0515542.1 hypothetical protein [Agromyces chromiiresistens]